MNSLSSFFIILILTYRHFYFLHYFFSLVLDSRQSWLSASFCAYVKYFLFEIHLSNFIILIVNDKIYNYRNCYKL